MLFGRRGDIILIDPDADAPKLLSSREAPVGFANLMTLLDSPNVVRIPLRELYGRPAHCYSLGFYPDDAEAKAAYEAAPYNQHAVELLARNGLEMVVNGRMVVVRGDAIDSRDLQNELVEADADTMPELERDHICRVLPVVEPEWHRIERAMQNQIIPSMLETAPTMDRIAWLIRIVITGLDMDIINHAAMSELFAKKPLVAQALSGLWQIQEGYFGGRFDEVPAAAEELDWTKIKAPPRIPPGPGYSQRYRATVQ